jgi:biopolymer transport protein ExbD
MAGGAPSETGIQEPDFTPMLDMTFLLTFFFAMTANFVQDQQFSGDIELPVAQFAGPLDNTGMPPAFINLDKDGVTRTLSEETIQTELEMKAYLTRVKLELDAFAKQKNIDNPQLLIILRADKETRYSEVWKTLDMCNRVGYSKWQIRVMHGI